MHRHKLHIKEFFRKLYQKRPIRWLISLIILLGLPLVGFYILFIEPRLIQISQLQIPIKRLPRPFNLFRLVQISDIHFGPANSAEGYLKRCVKKINNLKPDLIVITGDFMQWDGAFAKPLAKILSSLKAAMGVFGILGNHDYGICHPHEVPTDPVDHQVVAKELKNKRIRILHNEKVILKKGGGRLRIVGLGDYWTPHFKPEQAFKEAEKKERFLPTILLSHNPDSIHDLEKFPFDLMLAGHVHGGQISLPLIGPLSVPVKNRHLRRGLHKIGGKWLYANRGLGYTFKGRLLSRPEITCFELVPV